MKSFLVFSTILLASVVTVACSSGGRQNIPGRQCPANHAPINLKLNENQKTWKKGDNESAIPAGTYAYQRADLIYTEKGDKGAIVHIEDVPTKAGVFVTQVYCVRNGLNLSEKNLSAASNIVSKMIAKAGVAMDVEGKEISFKVVDRKLVAASKGLEKTATPTLEKIYENKATELFMIPTLNNNVDYEVRSVFEDNTGKFIVSVKFKRTN